MKQFFIVLFAACISFAQTNSPHFKKVIYIVFENEDQRKVISNAYFKSLADRGANFTNLKATIHPSQGNYIAMMAGDNYSITSDKNIDLNVPHLADLIENKHLTWKAYAEGYPGNCFTQASSGKYARKHVPFLSFVNVTNNPSRCANIVNSSTFFTDWKSGKLPNFSFYTPDLNNDGHDTSIDYSAKWLQKNFDQLFNDTNAMKDTLVILTYDEGSVLGKNIIYTVLLGSAVKPGSQNADLHSHYSLLKMIEDEWGLGSLNRNDAKAPPVLGIWK